MKFFIDRKLLMMYDLFLMKNPFVLFRKKFPLMFFILSRVFSMVVTLFILGLAVFAMMELTPGDVADNYIKMQLLSGSKTTSSDNNFSTEEIEKMRTQMGLDRPFYLQYFSWLKNVFVNRDLGRSLVNRAPLLPLVTSRMINSLVLNLISIVFLTIISFAIGIYLSSKVGTPLDTIAGFVGLFFHAFPSLLLLILLQVFAALSGWFPITAYPHKFSFSENPLSFSFSYLYHIFLPLLGAFLGGIGGTIRTIRSTMLDQLGQPYIRSLRARGISERKIYFAHAFRNTMNPYITMNSNLLASLFSGSLILEIIFNYPGIGKLMYEAILQEDVNLVMANIMFVSFLVLLGMIISDILLAVVDPRIKYGKL